MNNRPVNRCATKGCPVLGHWPQGGRCPMHAADLPARQPALDEIETSTKEYRP